jgi:integrase
VTKRRDELNSAQPGTLERAELVSLEDNELPPQGGDSDPLERNEFGTLEATEPTVRDRLNEVALERDLKPSTRLQYIRCMKQLGILEEPLASVTSELLNERLWAIVNPNTRRGCAAAARSVTGIKVRIGKAVPRRYDLPSEADLRFALMTSPHELRGLLAMYAGLRLGEACAVTRESLAGDRLRVDRQIQMLRETGKPTIMRVASVKAFEDDVVIPGWLAERVSTLERGDTAKPDGVRESVQRAFRRVGIKGMTFHGLRHWHATELLARGVPMIAVSRQLRHSDVATTMRIYIQVDQGAAIHQAFPG